MRELSSPIILMTKAWYLRLIMAILVAIFAVLLSNEFLLGTEEKDDWDSIEKAARKYFEFPSSDNARIFRNQIEPAKGNKESGRYLRLIGYVFDNLDVMERQVASGDREAIKLGFMLYSFAQGGAVIELDCIMGDLARTYPQQFLEGMSSSPTSRIIEDIGNPVIRSRLGLRDGRLMAYRYELEMRLISLKSVTSEALRSVRDRCINKIEVYLASRPDNPDIIADKREYSALFKTTLILMNREVEKYYLVCQRILEIEDLSGSGKYGVVSEERIHSSGLFDEMTTAYRKWKSMVNALRNPPLDYLNEYSILRTMGAWAGLLFYCATEPSFRDGSMASEEEVAKKFEEKYIRDYEKFRKEFAKMDELMPCIEKDVSLRKVILQEILDKLR